MSKAEELIARKTEIHAPCAFESFTYASERRFFFLGGGGNVDHLLTGNRYRNFVAGNAMISTHHTGLLFSTSIQLRGKTPSAIDGLRPLMVVRGTTLSVQAGAPDIRVDRLTSAPKVPLGIGPAICAQNGRVLSNP